MEFIWRNSGLTVLGIGFKGLPQPSHNVITLCPRRISLLQTSPPRCSSFLFYQLSITSISFIASDVDEKCCNSEDRGYSQYTSDYVLHHRCHNLSFHFPFLLNILCHTVSRKSNFLFLHKW